MTADNASILEAIQRLEQLAATAEPIVSNSVELPLAMLDAEEAHTWLLEDPEHLDAFLLATQAFIVAVRVLIERRVEGVNPNEFMSAATNLVWRHFDPRDD